MTERHSCHWCAGRIEHSARRGCERHEIRAREWPPSSPDERRSALVRSQVLLATNVGSSGVVVAFLLRLRVGWGYVSQRLREESTYYEENGASGRGGYVAEKDAEAKMRDRLLEEYEVQPTLKRVDRTLKPVVVALTVSAIALRLLAPSDPYEQYSQAYLSQLGGDERLAYFEQQRAQQESSKPSYCNSRYYKAIAGGDSSGVCN